MTRIFILRIFMGHEFDRVAHISAHPSWQAAETYAQETALPDARLGEAPEWHRSIGHEIEEIDFHGEVA